MHDLTNLSVADVAEISRVIHKIGREASCMENAAARISHFFYDNLVAGSGGERACVLARFFKTHALGSLEPTLRDYARDMLADAEVKAATKCLVLLGTAGRDDAWNSRHTSVGHRAIPLPSYEAVLRLPMISQLIRQLGLEVATVVQPDENVIVDLEERTCNVFYVPNAPGSPYIPAQEEFVRRHGVRSVVGFGGVMQSGNLFANILFTRTPVAADTAELFRIIAVSVKAAVARFDWGPTFVGDTEQHAGSATPIP